MAKTAVVVGAAEILGTVALIITTFTIPAFADMALAWRALAVFMTLEDGNRLSTNLSF